MRKEIYNQKNTRVIFNGIVTQGFASGTSITVEIIGGEADITEGTDGGGLNIATLQGIKIHATYRETSPSIEFFERQIQAQQNFSATSTVLLQTGADVKYTLLKCLVSKPENLSSGDKTQGDQEFVFVATEFLQV